ncbi:sugar phosphate isomerase/epimerase [Planctomycetota bacterium]|nr:sugar phosphate isomerase/epimerase [Planctomycetota bacterium]
MSSSKIPVGLQIYSIRQDAEKDLPRVLKEIASWGIDGVEFAGFYNHSASDIRKMLDDNNLKVFSSHTPIHLLEADLFEQADFHAEIGCDSLIVNWIPLNKRDSEEATKQTAEQFTQLLNQLKTYNQHFGFHCHAEDVIPLSTGKSPWQILGENTPDAFIMQYDTANGMHGGADPVLPIKQMPGRSKILHLKEFKGTPGTESGQGKAVLGEGDVPWQDVFEAAETVGGTEVYIIEQEGHPTLSPMDAARKCVENLKAMGK